MGGRLLRRKSLTPDRLRIPVLDFITITITINYIIFINEGSKPRSLSDHLGASPMENVPRRPKTVVGWFFSKAHWVRFVTGPGTRRWVRFVADGGRRGRRSAPG